MHVRRLALDFTPWALFRALAGRQRPFFIDAGQAWGEDWFSSMGFGPRMQLRVGAADGAATPLAALDDLLASCRPTALDRARPRPVPFAGGVVLGLAYDAKNTIERLPARQRLDPSDAYLAAALYDAVVSYDHRRREYVVASWHLDAAALARYAEEVLDAAADARALVRTGASRGVAERLAGAIVANLDERSYGAAAERVLGYIAAGDIYQANLSLRFEAAFAGDALELYGRLRALQAVPFGGYFDLGHERVLSNSPELFLRRRGTHVETCPIKGTRPRGANPAEDVRLAEELGSDAKEGAEHLMIVDLERSDLGRVCRTGSIRVVRFAEVARFRTVQHLVSTVTGTLPADLPTGALLAATFPGGSITGAPKIRAMEIIDEVERGARGFYTGALGWIDASGDCDLNVAIRTAVATDRGLAYHAGSGIVADSVPAREYAECLLKSQAFLAALQGNGDDSAAADRDGAAPLHGTPDATARADDSVIVRPT